MSLPGAFWRSRAAFAASAAIVARSTSALVSWWAETTSSSRPRGVVVAGRLVGAVLVRRQQRALDEARRLDVVRDLPAQHARAELLRAAEDRRGGHAGALVVELVALAEAGEHVPAPAGVGDRDLAERGLGLAGVDERLQYAVDVVGDRLALEHPDGDRVRRCVARRIRGRTHAHRAATLIRLALYAKNRDPRAQPARPSASSAAACPRCTRPNWAESPSRPRSSAPTSGRTRSST